MKTHLLMIILALIVVFSSILMYHIVSEKPDDIDKKVDEEDISVVDISDEIEDVLLDEEYDISVGEMI